MITIPSGVKFIRASFRIGNANEWHLKIDSLASKILSNELKTTKNTLDLEKVLSSGKPFDTATQDKFIKSDGTIATVSDATLCTTDYCRVFEGMSLHYIGGYQVTSSFIAVCGYADDNGSSPVTLIAFDKAGKIDETIIIPSGVHFVRACNRSSVVASPSLTLGTLESRIDNLESATKKTVISVKQDGTGDYTSVMDAIAASSGASSTNVFEIDVYEGVYDMIDEFFGESDYTDSPYKGPTLPNYVNLVGKGRRENIVLQAIFPNTIKYRTSQMFSTMNAPHNNVIENITFKAFNCRYPFHCQVDTGDVDYGRKRVVKNCVFIHLGYDEGATGTTAAVTNENNNTMTRWSSCHPYGQGTTSGCVSEFVDCDFICDAVTGSAFLTHDRQDVAFEDASVCFESCRFEISKTGNAGPVVALSSLDGEQDTPVTFKGCLFSSVSGSKAVGVSISSSNTSGECGYWVYGYGNDLNGLSVNMAVGYEDQNRMLL